MNPTSQDIASYLDGVSWVGLTFGTDLFAFKQPDSPNLCATVYDTGGFAPEPDYRYDKPTIMVKVRGGPNEYMEAYQIAENVKEALRGLHGETIGGTKYIGCWVVTDPSFIGYDQNSRPEITINFRLHRTE
jgi:hypothetical protein